MKTALNILLGIVLIIIALPFILVYANTHPPRYVLNIPPSDYHSEYETVSFITKDGLTLAGWLIKPDSSGTRSPAIIICHGLGANKSDFTDLAVFLAQRGYLVLAFDFRAHGDSEGSRTSLGFHEKKDVHAALLYLSSRSDVDKGRIGIFGFSLGGSTAILSAAETRNFRAIAVDSAFTSLRDQARQAITGFYHLPAFPFVNVAVLSYELYFQTNVGKIDPESVIGTISPAPILIIAGEGDDMIPAENGRRLYRAALEPKELWVIPVGGHGGTVASAGSAYNIRIVSFFDKHLKQQ